MDGSQTPFGGTHQLTTPATPPTGAGATALHPVTVADAATPREASGSPLIDPVWAYAGFR